MAIYKLFPEKDATLYTQNPTMNTGLDEILEASTYLLNDAAQTSRYLVKFSQNELNGAYDNYISGSGISYLSGNIASAINQSITDQFLPSTVYSSLPITSFGIILSSTLLGIPPSAGCSKLLSLKVGIWVLEDLVIHP